MTEIFTLEAILNSTLVKSSINVLFKNKAIEIIKRPASIIIRLQKESEDKAIRIILLPPKGFTANEIKETNPHPEVRKAKIEIKGGVKPNKTGFNLLKNIVKYQYYTVRNVKINSDIPYPYVGGENYKEEIKSSKQEFFVVKENGVGFYHSLVNLSDEWILFVLNKELRLQKTPNLQQFRSLLNMEQQKIINKFYDEVMLYGDELFERDAKIVEQVCNINMKKIIPVLIDMLNTLETGKHQPCTIYAVILNICKKNKTAISFIQDAIIKKTAPKYYLEELITKLTKYSIKNKI